MTPEQRERKRKRDKEAWKRWWERRKKSGGTEHSNSAVQIQPATPVLLRTFHPDFIPSQPALRKVLGLS